MVDVPCRKIICYSHLIYVYYLWKTLTYALLIQTVPGVGPTSEKHVLRMMRRSDAQSAGEYFQLYVLYVCVNSVVRT